MTPKEMIDRLITEGMSGRNIAMYSGVSQPTIWRIYKGVTKSPGYSVVKKIYELYRNRLQSDCGRTPF